MAGFDGVWVIPGSPYQNTDGVLAAIRAARTGRIPLLGTCGGFQHLMLEFARDVCGLTAVENAEQNPGAAEPLIAPLECSLLGAESTVVITPGTVAADAMGPGPTTERYFCRYGLNADYVQILQRHGLVFSGRDTSGEVRVAELPGHPFWRGLAVPARAVLGPDLGPPADRGVRGGGPLARGCAGGSCELMPVVPDTKDWTWVLQRRCPECGYDASAATRGRGAGLIRDNAAAWRAALGSRDVADLRTSAARGSLVRRGVRVPRCATCTGSSTSGWR